MGMKEAFETFFKEMDRNSIAKKGKLPRVPYTNGESSKELILTETLEDGYAVWRPELQKKKLSFEEIEEELGFKIHPQIKQYVNTYYFLRLEGRIMSDEGEVLVSLDQIIPTTNLANWLKYSISDSETHYLNDKVFFLIGSYCNINGIDSYLVHVDNETCEVTAVEVGDRHSVKLADSIEDLLMNMKGMWKGV